MAYEEMNLASKKRKVDKLCTFEIVDLYRNTLKCLYGSFPNRLLYVFAPLQFDSFVSPR